MIVLPKRKMQKRKTEKRKTQKRRTQNTTRALDFDVESLEKKEMLAGTVTASIDDGTLTISGDGKDNEINVYIDSDGNVEINALDGEIIKDDFSDSQVSGDVIINMRGGDDKVFVFGDSESDATINNIEVLGGGGNDNILVADLVGISGTVELQGGGGSDYLSIKYLESNGSVYLSGKAGSDGLFTYKSEIEKLQMDAGGGKEQAVEVIDSYVGQAAEIISGGKATIKVENSTIGDDGLYISTSGQDDFVSVTDSRVTGSTQIETKGGADYVGVNSSTVSGSIQIATKGGSDYIYTSDLDVGGLLQIEAGSSDDNVSVYSGRASAVSVITGSGRDFATIYGTNVRTEFVLDMQGGNDIAYLEGLNVGISIGAQGGAGNDRLDLYDNGNFIPFISGFETLND